MPVLLKGRSHLDVAPLINEEAPISDLRDTFLISSHTVAYKTDFPYNGRNGQLRHVVVAEPK